MVKYSLLLPFSRDLLAESVVQNVSTHEDLCVNLCIDTRPRDRYTREGGLYFHPLMQLGNLGDLLRLGKSEHIATAHQDRMILANNHRKQLFHNIQGEPRSA